MKSIWGLIFIALIVFFIVWFITETNKEPEHVKEAREKKKKLTGSIKKEENILATKERIRLKGRRFYRPIVSPGYLVLIAAFFGGAYGLFLGFDSGVEWGFWTYLGVMEVLLLVVTFLWKKKPIEFIQLLGDYDPQLRKWCYGRNRGNIEGQINIHRTNIFAMKEEVRKQDDIISEWRNTLYQKIAC